MLVSPNPTVRLAEGPILPPFRAVVMDMDGLALDTEATYCDAWRAAAAALGFQLSEPFCHGLFGRHADDVHAALAEACGEGFDLRRFFGLAEEFWHAQIRTNGVAKMPALDRFLGLLRQRELPYALATNSDSPYAREVLEQAGARDLFPIVVTRDEVAQGKPAPDLFLEGARRLGADPAECLGLEDSLVGLQACQRAGLIPVLIPSRAASASRPPDGTWVLPSLGALADCIERSGDAS
ncbi:HAD family hydrolase [Methylotetracoccus oryzae]|uniref:HAD family hydrolase n=1 Tax=Methylotetracoccus oryzae TaxID=1919059 RepID=UPI001118C3A3|nr:HAD family phosphatase [Methylotetracoccus oryzae]